MGGTRSRGSWSGRTVYSILMNPKYTGYMVWNRRARNSRQGRFNPPALWVWSPEVTHPPIVSLDTYRAAAEISNGRRGSRSSSVANTHPATERSYLLRSYVRCAICGRRMEATTRKKQYVYLRCRIRPTSGHDAHHRWPGHPADIYVPQHLLRDGILDFFADRVFGKDRHYLLG
ncbi:recombinase family protein, partial [Frankia sp. CiP3]|uniref:recombinase family protein n=1 Tax=Frankia sp. CiP3 TaxID=2880971 RepID=UPI00210805C3